MQVLTMLLMQVQLFHRKAFSTTIDILETNIFILTTYSLRKVVWFQLFDLSNLVGMVTWPTFQPFLSESVAFWSVSRFLSCFFFFLLECSRHRQPLIIKRSRDGYEEDTQADSHAVRERERQAEKEFYDMTCIRNVMAMLKVLFQEEEAKFVPLKVLLLLFFLSHIVVVVLSRCFVVSLLV